MTMKQHQNDDSGHSQDHGSTPTPAASNGSRDEHVQLQNDENGNMPPDQTERQRKDQTTGDEREAMRRRQIK